LLTHFVFTTLKPPMTEGIRRTEIPGIQKYGLIRTGIEGFADGMRIFPRLKEWENQIALQALREGKTVDELRHVTPFRQYLNVARRATIAGRDDPFIPFTNLFDASPRIDMLVSLGNFHPIRTWTWTLAKQYPGLHLPLELFFQDALYYIAPYSARSYDPSFNNPFHNFLAELLKKRFRGFVTAYQREVTAPASFEEKSQSKKGKPAQKGERVMLASLDAQMQHVETPQTLFEFVETTHLASQDMTQLEDQEARDKIHLLSQLAGLTDKQEETLVALYVYGGDTKLISNLRRRTTRMVRMYRQDALSKLAQLGYETVQGVLTGTYPTP
jgi:DNA-directed RNA polymerase specialized sigma24 family protein